MATLKDLITKLKTYLSEADTDIQLMDFKTADGLILQCDALEIDMEIFIIDETGKNPAADGEYILEDGTKIEVLEGKIAAITPPTEEVPEEEVPEEIPVEETKVEGNAELISRLEKLETNYTELKEAIELLAESFSKTKFEKDVKMSKKVEDVVLENETNDTKVLLTQNPGLSNILKNMYKK